MVIALINNRRYKIQCRNGEVWWALIENLAEDTGHSPNRLVTFEYGEKITFVAQGERYYYPWIALPAECKSQLNLRGSVHLYDK